MRLNLAKLAQMAGAMFGLDRGRLSDAMAAASGSSSAARTRGDAAEILRRYGVDDEFLRRVRGKLDTPMASGIASMLGADIGEIRRNLDSLRQPGGGGGGPADGRIERMRERLSRVGK